MNTLLAAFHALIARESGSLAVAAELTHNIVDLLASLAVLIGLKLAMRESKDFSYGLYKVENLVAAGLAALIFLTAYEMTHEALLAPLQPVRTEVWMLATLVVTMAMPLPLVFSRFELRAGRLATTPASAAPWLRCIAGMEPTGRRAGCNGGCSLNLPGKPLAGLCLPAIQKCTDPIDQILHCIHRGIESCGVGDHEHGTDVVQECGKHRIQESESHQRESEDIE